MSNSPPNPLKQRMLRVMLNAVQAGGPGSGRYPLGSGKEYDSNSGTVSTRDGKQSYPTPAEHAQAVQIAKQEVAKAKQELDQAMQRDISQDKTISTLNKQANDLEKKKQELIKKAEAKKAAIAKKYEEKKAAQDAKLAKQLEDAGL